MRPSSFTSISSEVPECGIGLIPVRYGIKFVADPHIYEILQALTHLRSKRTSPYTSQLWVIEKELLLFPAIKDAPANYDYKACLAEIKNILNPENKAIAVVDAKAAQPRSFFHPYSLLGLPFSFIERCMDLIDPQPARFYFAAMAVGYRGPLVKPTPPQTSKCDLLKWLFATRTQTTHTIDIPADDAKFEMN